MTRLKFTAYLLSSLLLGCLTVAAGYGADGKPRAAGDPGNALVLDVALDGQTLNFSRIDASGTGPARGDTFIITGRVYAGGSIPDGDTTYTFAPDTEGSIGSITCTGMYTTDATSIAAGAPLFLSTNHLLQLDTGDGLMTQGLEGVVTAVRALIGGMGQYSGAVGQVTQEVLGTNGTGGRNLRLTFQMVQLNPQTPESVQQALKAKRR